MKSTFQSKSIYLTFSSIDMCLAMFTSFYGFFFNVAFNLNYAYITEFIQTNKLINIGAVASGHRNWCVHRQASE